MSRCTRKAPQESEQQEGFWQEGTYWEPERGNPVRDALAALQRTDALSRIRRRLEKDPSALAHPAVVKLMKQLRLLARAVELDGEDIHGDGESLPPGTRNAAVDALRRLAEAVVTGIFQTPGWSVSPPSKKVGRPARSVADTVNAYDILSEYKDLLGCLRARKGELKARRESHNAWMGRVAILITEAWKESEITRRELPNDIARKSAEDAKATKKGSVAPAKIATYLLAHRWNTHPNSIRVVVERARKAQ
jgi:hypothetical protein